MWRPLSLLIFCCALRGLDALEADESVDPSQVKMPLTRAVPSAAEEGVVSAGGVTQPPGKDTPLVGAVVPTAEPLEDEVDNQENIISQVSVMSTKYYEHLHAKNGKRMIS